MKDHFLEEVVIKQKNTVNKILYYFSWILIVFTALMTVIMFNQLTNFLAAGQGLNLPALIFMLVCGGICVYTYLIHDKFLTEFEYTFTNGALDFAEVYNNKKRKALGSLNVKNIEAFGKVSSEKFRRYLNMPDVKRMNWFLNREAELYYFYFSKDNNRKMIILEPSEEMVSYIKQYIPRGTWQE